MKLRKSFAIVFCALLSLAANAAERDEFFWLGEMNKATAVINSEEGLLDKAVTPKIARGIAALHDQDSSIIPYSATFMLR